MNSTQMTQVIDKLCEDIKLVINNKTLDYSENDNVYSLFETQAQALATDVESVILSRIIDKTIRMRPLLGKEANSPDLEGYKKDLLGYALLLAGYGKEELAKQGNAKDLCVPTMEVLG